MGLSTFIINTIFYLFIALIVSIITLHDKKNGWKTCATKSIPNLVVYGMLILSNSNPAFQVYSATFLIGTTLIFMGILYNKDVIGKTSKIAIRNT